MPAVSQAQRRFMCARAKDGKGIKKSSAEEFCHTPGKLPRRKTKAKR